MFDEHLLESDSLLILRPEGKLDKELSRQIIEGLEKREAVTNDWFDRFVDMRALDGISVELKDVKELARRRRDFNPNQGRVKAALLADTSASAAIAKAYGAFLQSDRIQVQVFSRLEEAATWLEVDVAKLRPVRT